MKTIFTTLPIYNRLEKQCYERAKHATDKSLFPIISPRHRLPSFQWLDGSDGAASVSVIELINSTYPGTITSPATTWAAHIGFQLGGDSNHFTHTGLEISDAENDTSAGPIAHADTNTFAVVQHSTIRVKGTLAVLSGAATFKLYLGSASETIVAGAVDKSFTVSADDAAAFIKLESDGATRFTFTGVTITLSNGFNITSYFPSLPALAHDYFTYSGDTLNYLLPTGTYYLRITTNNDCIYYSEWFNVDCVFPNLITTWNNSGYETATTSGTTISSLINSAGSGILQSDSFNVYKGETIMIVLNITKNSGTLPAIYLANGGWTLSDGETLVEGLNYIELTSPFTGPALIIISNNASNVNMATSEVLVFREYSEKYLTIDFHNDCDLGDFYYHGGFTQSLWFESEPMEISFPTEEESVKNGEGQVVRMFARQDKKYIARTKEMPDYMVDVFNRMRLHDTIQITDLVGDTNDVYNLEVEHEWIGTDKYYAIITLTFDFNEAVVIAGCCNNIT